MNAQIREQDIDCKFQINQEVIINYGLYKNNRAIIKKVKQEKEEIIYMVQLKILQTQSSKYLELEFPEDRLITINKFKFVF